MRRALARMQRTSEWRAVQHDRSPEATALLDVFYLGVLGAARTSTRPRMVDPRISSLQSSWERYAYLVTTIQNTTSLDANSTRLSSAANTTEDRAPSATSVMDRAAASRRFFANFLAQLGHLRSAREAGEPYELHSPGRAL